MEKSEGGKKEVVTIKTFFMLKQKNDKIGKRCIF